MKIKKIAEGAYFVPPYFLPKVDSPIPGSINQAVSLIKEVEEDVSTTEEDTFTKEEFEEALRKVSRPNKHDEGKNQT